MRLTDLLAAGVQHLAGRKGVIILGVNKEDRRRDVVHGSKKPSLQFRRAIKAIAGSRENYDRSQVRFTLSTVREPPNECPTKATSLAST